MKNKNHFIFNISCLLLLSLGFACSAENHGSWEVSSSIFFPTDTVTSIILTSNSTYSDTVPYRLIKTSDSTLVFGEVQEHIGAFAIKYLLIEVPDSLFSFRYENLELIDSIDCIAEVKFGKDDDGWYRLKKGYIEGNKISGVWQLDFDVSFGGKDNSKFRMVKDADY